MSRPSFPTFPWARAHSACRTASLGLALMLLPTWLCAQNTHDQQREAPEVRKLSVEGVKHVDLNDLEKSLSTRPSKCRSLLYTAFCMISHSPTVEDKFYLDEAEFRRDVLRVRLYYWKRGYRETTVDTVVKKTGPRQVALTFKVMEGQPTLIRKVAINYDSTLISEKIRDRLTLLHANDPLDLIVLDSMRVLFQNQLWDQGFGDAFVDTSVVVNQPAYQADVSFHLTPNRRTTIGRVTVAGNNHVNTKTVLNSLTFHTGDLFRQSSILESQRNLYESNLFRLVAVDAPPQYDSVKNVTIDVTEAPLHEARVGPGLSNIDFLQFQSHYTSYNLFGGARRLDVDFSAGNLFASSLQGRGLFYSVRDHVPEGSDITPFLQPTYNASIDLKQPAFLQRPADAFGVGGFAHRSINAGVFVDRGYGGQATFTHQLQPRTPISLNYRYELNRVDASDVYFCVDFGVCDHSTIDALRSHQSLSPLTLTGFIDRSDKPLSPTKGYVARLDLEHASAYTASDYRYNRAFLDAAFYTHRSGHPTVFSGHLRAGWVRALETGVDSGVLHPRKRFYAGGANSVRGYAESMLGPKVLTIQASSLANSEIPSLPGGTCAATVAGIKFCDPTAVALKNSDFTAQPLGGTSLLEGSIEMRTPLPLGPIQHFVGAIFIDGGVIGAGNVRGVQTLSNFVKGTGAVTPGVGIRYDSPVGPIRVDVGLSPNRSETLGVVTAVPDSTGKIAIVPLGLSRKYSPYSSFLSRLVLHFSIGEAY
jgi:outer membrane protein assembly factor BamA